MNTWGPHLSYRGPTLITGGLHITMYGPPFNYMGPLHMGAPI